MSNFWKRETEMRIFMKARYKRLVHLEFISIQGISTTTFDKSIRDRGLNDLNRNGHLPPSWGHVSPLGHIYTCQNVRIFMLIIHQFLPISISSTLRHPLNKAYHLLHWHLTPGNQDLPEAPDSSFKPRLLKSSQPAGCIYHNTSIRRVIMGSSVSCSFTHNNTPSY